MALVESEQPALGDAAPGFDLPATDGQAYALDDFDKPVLVVMFLCNHCPYVKAVRGRLIELADDLSDQGVDFVAISSNDAERYPEDSFERMAEVAEEYGLPFPYLYDESQQVARSFGAACTPDIFVYDSERRLRYRGRIDDNWKDASAVTRHDLRMAIEALLAGQDTADEQHPSMGCSIKWK